MIRCTNCAAILPDENINSQAFNPCPICGSLVRADVFPAANNTLSGGSSGELLLMDDESSCFYHPDKQAVTTCSYCGRFLCSLCDIDFDDQHLCPACLDSGKKKGVINKLENRRILYDNIALGLAVFPILVLLTVIFWVFAIPIALITAPAAIIVAIRYWNRPSSIIKRGRLRMILALPIAFLQIAGLFILFYSLISKISS
ncbi:MAG: hypothetical protein JXL81_10255 [Deltaproteobacteria bacterium]|nr:hypothetical protein [Deltaproteobacteria bacterium]